MVRSECYEISHFPDDYALSAVCSWRSRRRDWPCPPPRRGRRAGRRSAASGVGRTWGTCGPGPPPAPPRTTNSQPRPVEVSLIEFGEFESGFDSYFGKFVQSSVVNVVKFDEINQAQI